MPPQLITGIRFYLMCVKRGCLGCNHSGTFKELSNGGGQKPLSLHVGQPAESSSSWLQDEEPTPETVCGLYHPVFKQGATTPNLCWLGGGVGVRPGTGLFDTQSQIK